MKASSSFPALSPCSAVSAAGLIGMVRSDDLVFSPRCSFGVILIERSWTLTSPTLRKRISDSLAPLSWRVTNIPQTSGSDAKAGASSATCRSLKGRRSSLDAPAPLTLRFTKILTLFSPCSVMARFTAALTVLM